jgi:hypothetical protein
LESSCKLEEDRCFGLESCSIDDRPSLQQIVELTCSQSQTQLQILFRQNQSTNKPVFAKDFISLVGKTSKSNLNQNIFEIFFILKDNTLN